MTVPRTEGLGPRISRLLILLACAVAGGLLGGYAGAAIAFILGLLAYEGLSRPFRGALLRSYLRSPASKGRPLPSEPFPGAAALLGFCLSFDPAAIPGTGSAPRPQVLGEGQVQSGDAATARGHGMRRLGLRERLGVLGGLVVDEEGREAGRIIEEYWDLAKDDASDLDPALLVATAAQLLGSWRLPARTALHLYLSAGGSASTVAPLEAWLLRAGCGEVEWASTLSALGPDGGPPPQEEAMPQSSTLLTRAPREQSRSVSRS